MTFCTDTNLLEFEPNICRDAAFVSQTLLSGSGDLAAASFTIDSGSLPAGPSCPMASIAASSNGTGSPVGLSSEWATLAVCEKSTAIDTVTNRRG